MIEVPLKIEIKESPGKGLGVFAKEKILKDEIIEVCPLIKLDVTEESNVLFDYRFGYPSTGIDDFFVIPLGYGCIYNHSEQNNAEWRDGEPMTFEFFAIKDIEPGEEICTCYGGSYYFELRSIKWL